MSEADEREKRRVEFIGLGDRAEELLNTDFGQSAGPAPHASPLTVYKSQLLDFVRWRDEMLTNPGMGSSEEFQQRIDSARYVLHIIDPLS